jgi:hypothetical protein
MSELGATADVVTLAEHADGLGTDVARRLDEHGIETIADILIADKGVLTDVPYVSDLRADTLREIAEDVAYEEPDPLVESREAVLKATLGEKLQVTCAERDAWATPWAVIEAPESTEWESAHGDNWHTRRLRISESATGRDDARECDLVLAGDEIRIEDPPVKHVSHQPDAPGWSVEAVGSVGRVSTNSLIQLQPDKDDQGSAKPEGDDTWRKYQNQGETA